MNRGYVRSSLIAYATHLLLMEGHDAIRHHSEHGIHAKCRHIHRRIGRVTVRDEVIFASLQMTVSEAADVELQA